jgi:MOSC domain-containing protein YiiM
MTRGIALNNLVGREFTIGAVRFRGIRLCEPCAHLQKLTQAGVIRGLAHRGGLNAEILTDGVIRVGDAIRVISG